jgi:hypothetical protein
MDETTSRMSWGVALWSGVEAVSITVNVPFSGRVASLTKQVED